MKSINLSIGAWRRRDVLLQGAESILSNVKHVAQLYMYIHTVTHNT